jgi:hypothetical protein
MQPCSILANRKQLATGSFISRVPSSRYSSYGGCCAFSFSNPRVPVAIGERLVPNLLHTSFHGPKKWGVMAFTRGAALYTRSGKRRSAFSVGDKSPFHHLHRDSQLVQTPVAVEKLGISEIRANLGDRKCPGDPRRSFVGHPNAILFCRFLRE